MNTEVIICVCKHPECGYRWIPRTLGRPARCPKCQSRRWDQPRDYTNSATATGWSMT